jgi:hypothetical protein
VVLVDFLRTNADIFAWSPSDMPGIPREVAEHSLYILPHSCAVQQRLRCFDEERRRAIGVELQKLLEVGFIKEVFHPTWLANPVLVTKSAMHTTGDMPTESTKATRHRAPSLHLAFLDLLAGLKGGGPQLLQLLL